MESLLFCTFRASQVFNFFRLAVLTLPFTMTTPVRATTIRVIERDDSGELLGTYEISKSPLIKKDQGVHWLNVDESRLEESTAKKLLSANFDFKSACRYNEFEEFRKKRDNPSYVFSHPRMEHFYNEAVKRAKRDTSRPFEGLWDAELVAALDAYSDDDPSRIKRSENCFADELLKLMNSHECLSKNAKIEIVVRPSSVASLEYNHGNGDLRRIDRVAVLGCPDDKKPFRACYWKRERGSSGFLTPPIFREFTDECARIYKTDPDVIQKADQVVHGAKRSAR